MDTESLTQYMKRDAKTKKYFKGVFACNLLPKQLEKNSLYVINLSPSHMKGSHWVLISTINSQYSSYICSLGTKPTLDNIVNSLLSVSNIIVYNNYKNQGNLATVCGWHVIFTAYMLSRNHSLFEIMTSFYTSSSYINDRAIVEIISTHFRIRELIPISDWNFIFSRRESDGSKTKGPKL